MGDRTNKKNHYAIQPLDNPGDDSGGKNCCQNHSNDSKISCDLCRKMRHVKEKFYKLHNYSPSHKLYRESN